MQRLETPYHPKFERLLKLAISHRKEFAVLTPIEREVKERAKVNAYICNRLSKEEEKEEKRKRQHSIDFQRRINTAYVNRQGYTLKGEASDVNVSGKDFEAREEYNKLKTLLSEKRPGGPIVFSFLNPDRFARSVKDGIEEIEALQKMGIEVEFSDVEFEFLNYGSPEMKRMRLIEELAKAERERLMLIHRTKLGLEEAKIKGIHLGHVPRYYTKDEDGRLVPTAKVERVCRMRVEGDGWRTIARETGLSTGRCRAIVAFVADRASKALAET